MAKTGSLGKVWTAIGNLSIVHWLATIGGGLVTSVAGAIANLPLVWIIVLGLGVACLIAAGSLWYLGRKPRAPSPDVPPKGRTAFKGEDSDFDLEDTTIKNQDAVTDLKRSKFKGKNTKIE